MGYELQVNCPIHFITSISQVWHDIQENKEWNYGSQLSTQATKVLEYQERKMIKDDKSENLVFREQRFPKIISV